jgi:PhnB protein
MTVPGSKQIMHACLQIGTSKLFLCDEMPSCGEKAPKDGEGGSHFYLYVADVDVSHKQAKAAGMKELSAPNDMFWGDRMSSLIDLFGHKWDLASHVRDVTPDEMAEAMKQFAKP